MADVQPLRALHYDSSVIQSLADVTAPPYDVISPQQRAALLDRSPYNVVAIDLPAMTKEGALEASSGGEDPYEAAGRLFAEWQRSGALRRDEQPAFWAHAQEYTGPDGIARTRRGFFCKVRIEDYGKGRIRPHERTHPGPKEDRLRLMRATKADTSAIFSLYSDPSHAVWDALAPAGDEPPAGEVTDGDGTVHRIWRVGGSETIDAVREAMKEAELLIADGHHRYETARTYAEEIGGDGPHRYVLMCLVALDDPGLTVFPTHRLVSGLDAQRRAALAEAIARDFTAEEVPMDELAPPQGEGPLQMGYLDSEMRPTRLTLRDQAIADLALPGRSEAYRKLDTGVLEALLLGGALGLTEQDIAHLNGLRYARDTEDAISLVRSGDCDAAFLMRPTPVNEVRDVAAAGENMPPKSTYFFPKLLTGLLFNELS